MLQAPMARSARAGDAEASQRPSALSALSGRSDFEASPVSARQGVEAKENLARGARGDDVRALQTQLQRAGINPGPIDGKFGPLTEGAVKRFQGARGLERDGIVGDQTRSAFERPAPAGATASGAQTAVGARPSSTEPQPVGDVARPGRRDAANGTARLDNQPRGPGLARGSITVNGNTYQFNSGSSRLFSAPEGTYRVTAHRNSRSDPGFVRDGVGYSFKMEDPRRPGSDRFFDPRAGRDRQYLRIHPDGGATGTAGCIGIVGDAATQRRFRADLNAELARNNGVYMLRVGR
jgi:peptidoglycan hydrolase-like protein with peptidoglycan-binding domain